ncbi:unnamed protein product [Rotaria socialis]|uniref:Uncharacterized protein n=1 Tax=Rotaria socialis TaxID=392032 RepID=A0A817Z733_9BILA|nr:unnamed protein product [Rotaria socialis]CAF3288714.1 unnamed protein product [Rotaria socialis]CAF3389815.1 unnamed protein product [Rotaria socialis]CAF3390004.1 unnamed protein product [Rotaria socialis]CAF3740125.1 unnamed protein product [Rotaria socialis]
MTTSNAARFFDTSGCLNLSRPTSNTRIPSAKQQKPNVNRPGPIRGQVKIDLYNFDHIDFIDSQYVLTSPRSLEACARMNVKPTTLLPRKLADISSEKVRYSTLVDVHDEMEIERLAKLQRCREEREKIIQDEELTRPLSAKIVDPKPSYVNDRSTNRKNPINPKFHPPSTSMRSRSNSITAGKPSRNDTHFHRPVRPTSGIRPTVTSSNVKPSIIQWPSSDSQDELQTSSSAGFLDDVRRMDESLQRLGTSSSKKNERYIDGLANVKQIIEQRVTQTTSDNDLENLPLDKNQYELLLSHYDHELKIQKARENARRTEKEKEAERYDSLMHDFLDQTMAEERRQNELRRKLERLHHSRQLYETLQAKNHELQMADVQKRRSELLNEIKRKDRRTQHFVKDKQETTNLSRTLAKSSQDTREYIRETNESFDQKARKAELASSILVTKPKINVDRRFLQSSLRT